jgi:hypothetical protein
VPEVGPVRSSQASCMQGQGEAACPTCNYQSFLSITSDFHMRISTATWKSSVSNFQSPDVEAAVQTTSYLQNTSSIEKSHGPHRTWTRSPIARRGKSRQLKSGRMHMSISSVLPQLKNHLNNHLNNGPSEFEDGEIEEFEQTMLNAKATLRSLEAIEDNAEVKMLSNAGIPWVLDKAPELKGSVSSTNETAATPTESSVVSTTDDQNDSPYDSHESPDSQDFQKPPAMHYTLDTLPPHLKKYWNKRTSLFHKYDGDQDGIWMDDEGWYSVTPETVAKHHADKIANCFKGDIIVVDAFCGVGGNTIQFALHPKVHKVIAVDVDPVKIKCAQHNARIYGVPDDKIEWKCLNVLDFLNRPIQADAVFASPPWGGPTYLGLPHYSLQDHMFIPCDETKGMDGIRLWKQMHQISPNVAMFLPRNTRLEDLAHLSDLLEVEENQLNGRTIAWCVYGGDLSMSTEEARDFGYEVMQIVK